MHYQKSWEGQLTTQVRLEHVVWGEALWATTLATAYAAIVCVVLAGFGWGGWLKLYWGWLPLVIPLLFIAALAFAAVGPCAMLLVLLVPLDMRLLRRRVFGDH